MRPRPTANIHLLADPTTTGRGGIATYCRLAAPILRGLGREVWIIKRHPSETLADYRLRLAEHATRAGSNLLELEAPETYGATVGLPAQLPVHIRLHCARSLGALWEGRTPDPDDVALERAALAQATWISAPSVAARDQSRRLFELPCVSVFPNPAPSPSPRASRGKHNVLILGRAQRLKGIEVIPALLDKLPVGLSVTLAGPDMPRAASLLGISGRVTAHGEVGPKEIQRLLQDADALLVCSLFETFSMVAVEALAAGVPVVAWDHTGTAELAAPPLVMTAPAWDLDRYAAAIQQAIAARPPAASFAKACEEIRNGYAAGIQKLHAAPPQNTGAEPPRPSPQPPAITRSETMLQTLPRKLRKLTRDPRRFLGDSKLLRSVAPDFARRLRAGGTVLPPPAAAKVSPAGAYGTTGYRLAGREDANGQIEVLDLQTASPRRCSIIAVTEQQQLYTIPLLKSLKRFGRKHAMADQEHVRLVIFTSKPQQSLADCFARIDAADRHKLAAAQNIIVVDPTCDMGQALRSCHPASRLFVVLTPWATTETLNAANIDTLIVPMGHKAPSAGKFRRVIRYAAAQRGAEADALAGAILRAIEEAAPKPKELLLPAFGECDLDASLLDVDTSQTEGLLLLHPANRSAPSPSPTELPKTFGEQVQALAPNIRGLLLAEGAMWRYRSLLDAARTEADCAAIVALALKDGLRIEVRLPKSETAAAAKVSAPA